MWNRSMTPASVAGQRVYNALHHLEDASLPYDLWNDDAELAALIFLLRESREESVTQRFFRAVREYNHDNARIGVPVRPYNETTAKKRIRRLSQFVARFPRSASAATIYLSALDNRLETSA